MYYKITNGSVTLKGNTILEEINFDVKDHDKIAIVGPNGSGKTTLLNAIIDNNLLEEGIGENDFDIVKQGDFQIGYLSQMSILCDKNSLEEELLKVFKRQEQIKKELDEIIEKMNDNNSIDLTNEYNNLKEKYDILGGFQYKKQIEVMINKFGFSIEDKIKKISSFSGGEKTKISLMKLLLSKPDLLILDEPTNHLDISTIEWLEEYLINYKSSIILVSHDRMFLDKIVNIVYDIDYGKTVKYYGNYQSFEIEKKLNYEKWLKNYEIQQKEIKRLNDIYLKFRNKPTKAKMALSKLKQIERMDLIDAPNKESSKTFKINLTDIKKSGYEVLKIKKLKIGYDTILKELNFTVNINDKIGIIGSNGSGKSTFLKTINGDIKPISGKVIYGSNVSCAYFDQQLKFDNDNLTVLEEMNRQYPNLSIGDIRSILGSFLFTNDDINKKINVLSGGEKVRLSLCILLNKKPNLLILDEPTNHMDILSKSRLEEILNEYKGTIIMVSHDRYFISKVANKIIVMDGEVSYYNGNYNYYLAKRKINEKDDFNQKTKKEKINKEKNNVKELQKEVNKIEKEIAQLEKEINNCMKELEKEEVYTNYLISRDIEEKLEQLAIDLDDLNYLWENKSIELEQLKTN